MTAEPRRLYKLMVLYILNRCDFPLTNSQITDFMVGKEYTDYFTLQKTLYSLIDDGFLESIPDNNNTRYSLTDKGQNSVRAFEKTISSSIRNDIDEYIRENKFELRSNYDTIADYYRTKSGDYVAHLRVNENDRPFIDLSLYVPDEENAKILCAGWKNKNRDIYEYILRTLSSRDT